MPKYTNKEDIECCICLEAKHTIKQPCYDEKHRICTSCIFKIIKTIPISKAKPSICCQYPYEECKKEYSDLFIKSVLKDKYPIYSYAKDSYMFSDYCVDYCPGCKNTMVFDDTLEYGSVYECVYCSLYYCFTCGLETNTKESICSRCKTYESINPYEKNYFFYKSFYTRQDASDYFLMNKDIDPFDACRQIVEKVKKGSVNCPCCITPLQRSEQCNALSHCHIEICFWCGQFSKVGQSLQDHWSARGNGCLRWNSDPGMKKYLPDYLCIEGECYAHNSGDCSDTAHDIGKEMYDEFKKKLFVYHALKSLLPRIRYKVISYFPREYNKYLPNDITFDNLDTQLWNNYSPMFPDTE